MQVGWRSTFFVIVHCLFLNINLQLFQQFIMVTLFPVLCSSLGLSGTFFLFSSMAAISVLFGIFILPETKGKTLSDINEMFYTQSVINTRCFRSEKTEKYLSVPVC